MSGATGAGSAGTSRGTETGGGGRGSAARATDPHTTQLRKIDDGATDSQTSQKHGSQGGTVTDTRGQQTQQAASPLPGERQPQQPGGPYHPPQAYQTQGGNASAVRRPRTGARTTPRVRKARLRVSKADPWSVMKVSFLLSIALGICTIVASAVLWMVMDAMGVFSTVGGTISEATGSNESNGFDLQSFLSLPNVLLFATVIAVIDVVLATALATLGAFIYNLSAGFVGGVELTLAEDE
ncbi:MULTISPECIES: DUF3566 domain-containing protein [Streptomyces]|uniref:DUF3566 domain-containing protein n=2 Tax=Streptomyces TaxID=1883 RepID=A0A369VBG1_9ACTN|nr:MULTISPECIES: DUF3566 domain-containing protein [Streptomyces]MCQ4192256.1 DUF3566 domain-containing protein [Streptomyces parvulus]RDD89220.1 hypothetical protein DVZ84_09465 [Streptomyces parvulus]WHM31932.1 DUF3566 domain-containing protein [Streptomyces sp. BPPL-273]WML81390.1 DUF3566 domain-containing protein [Streptomyces sp. VNUA74]GGR57022.1 membrane protein [Streptomyces parvulus]